LKLNYYHFYFYFLSDRKEFLYHIETKIDAAITLTQQLEMQTILFGQSIKGADKIKATLGDKCVEYHSKLTAKQLRENLKRLRDGRTKIDYISSVTICISFLATLTHFELSNFVGFNTSTPS